MEWAPGDLALRVKLGSPCPDCGLLPFTRPGAVHTVREAGVQDDGSTYLLMERLYHGETPCIDDWVHFGEDAANYRKIEPHTPDAEDAETIYQLVYAPSPVFSNQIGDTAPVAAPSPEAANNGSGRGAVVICLGAPALSKTSDNVRGRHPDGDAFTAPLILSTHASEVRDV